MRVKVLSLALAASIMALPVPASQILAGPLSAPAPAIATAETGSLATLLQDPFLIDSMRFAAPATFRDLRAVADPLVL